jgi:hypothetical protein
MVTGVIFRGQSGRGLKLTTHLDLLPSLRINTDKRNSVLSSLLLIVGGEEFTFLGAFANL